MSRISDLLRRFRKDESGAFMVLFAVLALVLIATSGAVVDFTATEQSRTRAQTALDSAALALQPRIKLDTIATLKSKAQTIVTERLNDTTVTVTLNNPTVNTTEGTLELTASMVKNTSFVKLVGVNSITTQLVSQATRKQLDLEVVMVLDNSISMDSSSRMTNLKKAARCATDILFNSITACDDTTLNNSDGLAATNTSIRMGIVPFTEFVNVGSTHKTDTWITQNGATTRSEDNFDNDDRDDNAFTTAVNRFSLYTAIGQTWSGCVEDRNHTTGAGGLYYDTSDLTPDSTVGDSLFTPIFAPDEVSGGANSYLGDAPSACTRKAPVWTKTTTKTSCTTDGNGNATNYNNCSGSGTSAYTQKNELGTTVSPALTSQPADNTAAAYYNPASCADVYTSTKTQSSPNRWSNIKTTTCTYNFSERELQERVCKYVSGNTVSLGSNFQAGPNADCGVALLPLTTTKSSVISKIAAMGPDGGTNIHQGVIWGFHVISPTEPFTEAKSYDTATSKVMIIMTDGENTTSSAGMNSATAGNTISDWNGGEWYLAYGYPYSRRLDTSGVQGTTYTALQTEMNTRTTTTCANARAAGIVVYTIGLATSTTSNPTAVTAMLNACATDPDAQHAYFPANSTDLVTVFQTIAGQLADLRLAK